MSWTELVTCHPIESNFEKQFNNEVVNFSVETQGFSGFMFRGSATSPDNALVHMLVGGDTVTGNYQRHHLVARHVLQTNQDYVYGSYAQVPPDLLAIDAAVPYYHIEGTYSCGFGHFFYRVNFRAEETSPVVSSTVYTLEGSTLYTGPGDKTVVQITSGGQPASGFIKIYRFY